MAPGPDQRKDDRPLDHRPAAAPVGLWRRIRRRIALALVVGCVGALAYDIKTSQLQADVLSWFAQRMSFELGEGASEAIRFPEIGPYDRRLGYSRMPDFIEGLAADGFSVRRQARMSETLASFVSLGGFPIYREKPRAGLTILDRNGEVLHSGRFPGRTFANYLSVPPVVVGLLLFVENRELLTPGRPTRNPAVEWDRLAAAVIGRLAPSVSSAGGGSTLATQIEKFRHSPEGRTVNAFEKLRQMASASMRAYLDGPDTRQARRRIVVDYLNTTPLGGRRGFGEVHGLGDGLWAWYGIDLEQAGALLRSGREDGTPLAERAGALKAVLSLLLAQRRPSYYLVADRASLRRLTDSYLRLLAHEGLIGEALAQAALDQDLPFREEAPEPGDARDLAGSFVERKAANAIRAKLMASLGLDSPYELDRLDLTIETTLDGPVQDRVTALLTDLGQPAELDRYGLRGPRLLGRADPAKVVYSVTLYERGKGANYLRVQADTLDQPFDINAGAKLDLGSTAKLRTLATYLQIIAGLHDRLADHERYQLDAIARDAGDPLTRWVARRLSKGRARGATPSLEALLEDAMDRRYSASPNERFYTGGGIHHFANFRASDNRRVPSVREALRESINLPFIRLMRDIVLYHMELGAGPGSEVLSDNDHPGRQIYLEIFADSDGSALLRRYFRVYGGDGGDAALARLVEKIRPSAKRLTVLFRSTRPEAGIDALGAFLQAHVQGEALREDALQRLYHAQAPGRFSLTDRAFIAGVHPLELWLVTYLQDHPEATLGDVLAASAIERQAALGWLFRTKHHNAQNLRIRTVMEREAFKRIHRAWRALGYPFEHLVPSLATAIGSSADRPSALAELMGIILNDGLRLPSVQIDRLHFAVGTPYETEMAAARHPGRRVLPAAVAATLRRALVEVVESGTARRARGAFRDAEAGEQETGPVVGGKTGTGDNRYKRFSKGGRLISSQAVNRTATFVFFIGERFFGTVTAFVDGPESDRYSFTSSLPVQVLKVLAPTLRPLIDAAKPPGTSAAIR